MQVETGGLASVIVRGNPSAMAGYRISLDFDQNLVGLYLIFPGEPDRLLQERAIDLSPQQWHTLKVVVQGKILDIYVDGALYIVREAQVYDSGCFGLHARGPAQFRWRNETYAGLPLIP